MDININKVTFYIPKGIKNTTRLFRPQPIELKAYKKTNQSAQHAQLLNTSKPQKILENPKTLLSVTINTMLSLKKLSQDTWNKHSLQQGSTLHCLQPTLQDISVHQRHS